MKTSSVLFLINKIPSCWSEGVNCPTITIIH